MSFVKTDINHPFGRENEFALKLLSRYFFNNVYLGQWEAAKASLLELNAQQSLIPDFKTEDILYNIVERPSDMWYVIEIKLFCLVFLMYIYTPL